MVASLLTKFFSCSYCGALILREESITKTMSKSLSHFGSGSVVMEGVAEGVVFGVVVVVIVVVVVVVVVVRGVVVAVAVVVVTVGSGRGDGSLEIRCKIIF